MRKVSKGIIYLFLTVLVLSVSGTLNEVSAKKENNVYFYGVSFKPEYTEVEINKIIEGIDKKFNVKNVVEKHGVLTFETMARLGSVEKEVSKFGEVELLQIDNSFASANNEEEKEIEKNSNISGLSTQYGEVNVAVIDSGFDPNHINLKDKVVQSYDCAIKTQSKTCIEVDDEGTHSENDQQHGTHVAGIIASDTFGVAKEANLYLFAAGTHNSKHEQSVKSTIRAYEKILDLIDSGVKIDIVNMSYGSKNGTNTERALLKRIYDKGAILVASAGNPCTYTNSKGECTNNSKDQKYAADPNRDTINYPAKYDFVISVGAVDQNGNKADWGGQQSAAGKELDIVAPGTGILSTLPGSKYGRLSGTSMAAPYVTGVLARYKEIFPEYSNKEIVGMLYEGAIGVHKGRKSKEYGYGIAMRVPTGHFYTRSEIHLKGQYKVYDFADSRRAPYIQKMLNGDYTAIRGKGWNEVTKSYDYVYLVDGNKEIGWIHTVSK